MCIEILSILMLHLIIQSLMYVPGWISSVVGSGLAFLLEAIVVLLVKLSGV